MKIMEKFPAVFVCGHGSQTILARIPMSPSSGVTGWLGFAMPNQAQKLHK
jgi:hypothetical protein